MGALPSLQGCKPVLRLGSSSNNQVDGTEPAVRGNAVATILDLPSPLAFGVLSPGAPCSLQVTDNGNYIIDLHFDTAIKDPVVAGNELKKCVGVVDHGLFCGMTTAVIIAGKEGITVKTRP